MVDYDCIDAMVSIRSEGKIEWLQELGPIVKQRLMPLMAQFDGIYFTFGTIKRFIRM